MKKNLLSLLFLSLIALSSAFAQSRKISGTVTGADDGLSLPGVSVIVQGTKIGTTTNAQGEFSINAPESAKNLVFSYIGYSSKIVAITGSVVNVKLINDSKTLTEIVVTGYGTAINKKDAVGTSSTVDAAAIEDKPVANVLDALQGKVSGLSVFTSSGEPSSTPTISLNGIGSLTSSNTPLIVMDGIPVDIGTLISLNPDDYESVTVLKDAASTSIYGSRAANGVILISTKKGSINKPGTISLTSSYGISKLANTDYFNDFMNSAQLQAFELATGQDTQAQLYGAGGIISSLPVQGADTKWYKQYYKDNQPTYSENLSLSGGGGKTTYFISAGYFNQLGLAYRSGYDRYTLRSNVTSQVTNWMQFGLNLSGGYDERQTNPSGSNSTNRGLALLAAPYFSPTGPDGNNYLLIPGWGRYSAQYRSNTNLDFNNNTQFDPSAFIQLTPVKGLTIRTQAGMDDFDYRETTTVLPSFLGNTPGLGGSDAEAFTRGLSKTFTNTIEYKFTVAAVHHFTILGGQEYTDGTTNVVTASSTGQTDDRLTQLAAGGTGKTVGSSNSEYSYHSLFSRLNYDFNGKYFLQGSIRQDKSSRFGVNDRAAVFYSVGGTWQAKQESFFKDINWLSDFSVRASTGTTGNSAGIGNYQSLATVTTSIYNTGSGFVINQGNPGNPDLTWEKQQLTTVDFSASFFNKITLEASFYLKSTSNMLLQVPYAFTTGVPSVTGNTGTLQNKGLDLDLSYDLYTDHSHKAYITPYIHANFNQNKITKLFNGLNYYINTNTGLLWAIGQSVTFVEPVWAGVDPTNGNALWYNPDPNAANLPNKTTAFGTTSTFNSTLQQGLGLNRYPWLTGGFGLSAGYEGFTLDADFAIVQGKYLFNNDQYFFQNPNQFPNFNQNVEVLDYWKKPGDITTFPKYGVQFTQFDSRVIQDASFVRLKNLTIGYTIPKSVLAHVKAIKALQVFFTGRDLLTWTKYPGVDPEVDSNITLGTDPNTKQYSAGVKVTF